MNDSSAGFSKTVASGNLPTHGMRRDQRIARLGPSMSSILTRLSNITGDLPGYAANYSREKGSSRCTRTFTVRTLLTTLGRI